MSHDQSHHLEPGAGGDGYESDMTGGAAGVAGLWIGVLSVAFFATVGAVYMFFRYETDQEVQRKVWRTESAELKDLRAREDAALQGKLNDARVKVLGEVGAR